VRINERTLILNAIFLGIPLLFCMLPGTQPYMFAVLGTFFHALLWLFDCIFGAHIFPWPPPVSWLIIGTVIGASLGFWTIAPSLGKRHLRHVAATIPFIVLGGLAIADATFSLMNRTPDPRLPTPVARPAPATTQTDTPNGVLQ